MLSLSRLVTALVLASTTGLTAPVPSSSDRALTDVRPRADGTVHARNDLVVRATVPRPGNSDGIQCWDCSGLGVAVEDDEGVTPRNKGKEPASVQAEDGRASRQDVSFETDGLVRGH